MKQWQLYEVAEEQTHHLREGEPAYSARFESVMKFHEPGYAPVLDREGAYHIDLLGKAAYAARYTQTFGFYEHIAAVRDSSDWFHIDLAGEPLYNKRFAWCGNFQEGKSAVRNRLGHYYHINRSGAPLYRERYAYCGDFRDGIAVVCREDGRSSHIDSSGTLIHEKWYRQLDVFHKGFARAQDERGWFHITSCGIEAYPARFASLEPFYNGQAHAQRGNGDLVVIDERGREVHTIHRQSHDQIGALSGDLIGFWKSEVIKAAVELKLLDSLPGSAEEIHKKSSLPLSNVKRLLRALWEIDIVTFDNESWFLTEKGEILHPTEVAPMAASTLMWSDVQQEWKQLGALLQQETLQYHPTFKEKTESLEKQTLYQKALKGYSEHDFSEIAEWEVWNQYRTIACVGEAGYTLIDLIRCEECMLLSPDHPFFRAHPPLNGVQEIFHNPVEKWNFTIDCVIFPRFLHYFPDEEVQAILQNAFESLTPGGDIYIFEMFLTLESPEGSLLDINMMVESGGRLRTKFEWELLLKEVGFEVACDQTVKPYLHMLQGRKHA